ncbi:MAG: hypothetical protein R3F59_05025 [Myxococcota bacterium]
MNEPTLVYVPSRRVLWLRVMVREFFYPRAQWGRLLVGPALIAVGTVGIGLSQLWQSSALALVSGALIGIGIGWSSWPLAGASLAVMRSKMVRNRQPVRLVLTHGAIELVRGDDRRLFPLEDLERIEAIGGEHWLRFRGNRALLVPGKVRQGDVGSFLAAIRSYRSTQAAS